MAWKRLLLLFLVTLSRAKFKFGNSVFKTRTNYKKFSKVIHFLNHTPKDVTIEEVKIDGLDLVHLSPPKKTSLVILYMYGGGFVLGLNDNKVALKPFAAMLAKKSGAEVWIPGYRTAPEFAFPAQGEDCLKAYMHLVNSGIKPENITLFGNGSGAALALSLIFALKEKKQQLPGAIITVSAWIDLKMTSDSHFTRAGRDPMLNPTAIKGHFNHYLQGASVEDPMASPIYGDFTDFPPMYLIVGGRELFYDDTIRLAEKAKAAGVDVTLDVNEDMVYSYCMLFDVLKEAMPAVERLGSFVKQKRISKKMSIKKQNIA